MKPLPPHTVQSLPLKMRLPSHFGHRPRGLFVIIRCSLPPQAGAWLKAT
jgi:hypothetical protein